MLYISTHTFDRVRKIWCARIVNFTHDGSSCARSSHFFCWGGGMLWLWSAWRIQDRHAKQASCHATEFRKLCFERKNCVGQRRRRRLAAWLIFSSSHKTKCIFVRRVESVSRTEHSDGNAKKKLCYGFWTAKGFLRGCPRYILYKTYNILYT